MDKQAVFLVSPLARIFPPTTGDECAALRESIREAGLLEEITLWLGDGDRRLPPAPGLPAAGNRAGVFLSARRRRPSGVCYRQERLAPGPGSLATAHRGLPSLGVVPGGTPAPLRENRANLRNFLTQDEAARLFRVSRRPVTAAAKVLSRESRAIPELRGAVLSGRVTVSEAAAAVKEPAGAQRAAVDLALRRETKTVRQAVNMVKEESGLPEDIESAATIPDADAKVTPVFHQPAVAGLLGIGGAGNRGRHRYVSARQCLVRLIADGPGGLRRPFPEENRRDVRAGWHGESAGIHWAFEASGPVLGLRPSLRSP